MAQQTSTASVSTSSNQNGKVVVADNDLSGNRSTYESTSETEREALPFDVDLEESVYQAGDPAARETLHHFYILWASTIATSIANFGVSVALAPNFVASGQN
eukprot:6009546-Pleurochrysis_carterae.AAC.1